MPTNYTGRAPVGATSTSYNASTSYNSSTNYNGINILYSAYSNRVGNFTTYDYLLMETGGYILQEDGVSKFIITVNSGPSQYTNKISKNSTYTNRVTI